MFSKSSQVMSSTIQQNIEKVFENYRDNNLRLKELLSKRTENKMYENNIHIYNSDKVKEGEENNNEILEIRRLRRDIYLRDLLITILNEEEKKIVTLKFEENLRVYDIASSLYMSTSTYYRRLETLCTKLNSYYKSFSFLF